MSYDPGSPYASPMEPTGGMNQVAMGKVGPPAIALMVNGAINGLLGLINIAQGAIAMSAPIPPPPPNVQNDPNALQMYNTFASIGGPAYLVCGILMVLVAGVILLGAIKMKGLQSRGLAMTASVLAMIPCISCCIIGLPIGIWSIVTLNSPEVKSVYR